MTANDAATVGGAAVIVSIIVQVAKARVPEEWVALLALAIGVLLVEAATVAIHLTAGDLAPVQLFDAFLTGIIAGASSIGLYQVQKPAGVLPSKQGGTNG